MGASGSRPLCLVTGATGAIGPSVVAALAPTYDVRILARGAVPPSLFRAPVQLATGDVSDRDAVLRATDGTQVIVHLAARLHIVDQRPEMAAEYERVNVGGTEAVMAAALAQGVSRVVMMSSIAVYGPGEADEGSPLRPDTLYGRTKRDAESVALAARDSSGAPLATVLRSAAVYGPRVKGNYERLVYALARGRFIPIGPGENRRTLVHEQDLAAAIALTAEHPAAGGRIYNVSDGEPHRMKEIIAAICDALGRRPPRWHVPVPAARVAARAAALVDRRARIMVDKYLEEVAVDATRIQRELGYRPAISLRQGWALTIDEMRRDGRL